MFIYFFCDFSMNDFVSWIKWYVVITLLSLNRILKKYIFQLECYHLWNWFSKKMAIKNWYKGKN